MYPFTQVHHLLFALPFTPRISTVNEVVSAVRADPAAE